MSTENLTRLFHEAWEGSGQAPSTAVPNAIRENPERFLEAMVEDGILDRFPPALGREQRPAVAYMVPLPHVHDWRVKNVSPGGTVIYVGCIIRHCPLKNICRPNRIPLEVPE